MFWGKIEESKKVDSHWELNSGHLVCTASALPLSYGRGEKDVLRLFNLNLFIARWGMSSKHDYNYTCIYCHLWVIIFVTMCYSLNYSKIRKLAFWVLIFGVTSDLIHSQIQNLLHAFNPRLSPPTSLYPTFSDPISRGNLGMHNTSSCVLHPLYPSIVLSNAVRIHLTRLTNTVTHQY